MANTSSTGGYLSPAASPAPLDGDELEDLFQRVVTSITELPKALVRPRWQPETPKQPEPHIDWCAIGVMVQDADAGPVLQHDGSGDGSTQYARHEDIEVLASFYGPNSQRYAGLLRDGLAIQQNCEELAAHDVAFVDGGKIRPLPELVNQQWLRRRDILLRFRRKISRIYSIQNIVAADIHLIDDTHIDETISVQQPTP